MASNTKLCPVCGLLDSDSALLCDCGHEFKAHGLKKSLDNQSETILSWCLLPYQKWFVFKGRSRRKEYWMYFLFVCICSMLAGFMGGLLLLGGLLVRFLVFVNFVPGLSVQVRRLHDTNRSGWWVVIQLIPGLFRQDIFWFDISMYYLFYSGMAILAIFCAQDSHPGKNKYGPNPKTANTVSPDTT